METFLEVSWIHLLVYICNIIQEEEKEMKEHEGISQMIHLW